MTNNDIILLKQIAVIAAIVIAFIAIMIWSYYKQRDTILGKIAASIAAFWFFIEEKFGG